MPTSPALVADPTDVLHEVYPAGAAGDIARAGHRVLRRLADDPLVYHDDLDTAERDWLGPRWQVANRLAAELGLTLERRAEGFTAIDRSIAEPMTDYRFPAAGSTVAHCALLLAEYLVDRHRAARGPEEGRDAAAPEPVPSSELVAHVRVLIGDYAARCGWAQWVLDEDGPAQANGASAGLPGSVPARPPPGPCRGPSTRRRPLRGRRPRHSGVAPVSPSIQPLFRAQPDPDGLPTPTRPRYTLLRIGIQNIWEYDITTRFVARDGRLLLRGQNESGKTKAVEVSLPAVLDAILRAERLDPFGEQARTMREDLIGPHTDEDATVVAGYVSAQASAVSPSRASPSIRRQATGCGPPATLPGFTSWFFLTGLRPDLDLHLFVDGRPRSQPEARRGAGPAGGSVRWPRRPPRGGEPVPRGREPGAVRVREMAQFDNLLTLLIELRRPQLAKQLKASDLSRMLTTSLPSLDVNLITKVAEGVDRLEEHRAALEALRETGRTVRAAGFNITYRRYLQTVVAERTAVVRGATARVDETARALKGTQATLQAAKHAMQAASTRRRDLRVEEGRLRARVETIKDSDAYRATKDLDDAKRRAVEAAEAPGPGGGRLGREHPGSPELPWPGPRTASTPAVDERRRPQPPAPPVRTRARRPDQPRYTTTSGRPARLSVPATSTAPKQ